MDDSARSVLAAAARRHGRELSALAYLILQNRAVSEAAAAAGLADAHRGAAPAPADPAWAAMVGAVLRRALEVHDRVREIDAPSETVSPVLTLFSPLQGAVVGAHLVAGVPLEELASPLGISVDRLRHELRAAENVGGNADHLRRTVERALAGRAFAVTAEQIEASLGMPPPRAIHRSRRFAWLLGGGAAVLLVVGALVAAGRPPAASAPAPASAPADDTPAALADAAVGYPPGGRQGAGAWGDGPRLPFDDRLTLADCDIQPASTPIAFRGWLTLGDLSAAGRDAPGAGTPAYVLVTDGPAEWIGWQTTEGRPMYPRPVGRMACAVNPLTATATVFSVSDRWRPPELMDGCPASPILRYAGDHQVGGPSAFVLLPFDTEAWWSKTSIVLRVRIVPSPEPGARISATARLLDGSRTISLPVDSLPIPESRPPTSSHYLWLRPVIFPTDGCWLVEVAVDGTDVGATILPITAPAG